MGVADHAAAVASLGLRGSCVFATLNFRHAARREVLSDIKLAGGVFRLVFFNALRTFYSNYSDSIWVLREVFLIHCQQSGLTAPRNPIDFHVTEHNEFIHIFSPKLLSRLAVDNEFDI